MTRSRVALCVLISPLLAACADRAVPTAPAAQSPNLSSASPVASATTVIKMRDNCDPITFNAIVGPGTCYGDGRTTFQAFIAELAATRRARLWKNAPDVVHASVGVTLDAVNVGGEVHTFTLVARYAGGIVPVLNQLSHIDHVAPECTQLEVDDFVPPGGHYIVPTGGSGPGVGTHLFQCCIHPWMRTTATLQ